MSQPNPISNTSGEIEEVQTLKMMPPLIFSLPRHEPDMLIEIFHRPFHVHSIILRIHCGFFAKFLDSPDKKAPSANGKFRYHYVAVIDMDGTGWGLQTADSAMPLGRNKQKFARFRLEDEEVDFEEFLKAMYGHEYMFQDNDQTILNLVKYADYYDALPWLSLTLDGALGRDHEFSSKLQDKAGEILVCAKRLRHARLFRDCFVHVVGFWNINDPAFRDQVTVVQGDPELVALIEAAQSRISEKLMGIGHHLYILSSQVFYDGENTMEESESLQGLLTNESSKLDFYDNPIFQAWFYRGLAKKLDDRKGERSRSLRTELNQILRSNLLLDGGSSVAGEDDYYNTFLCAEISDEDLPWVPFETFAH